MFRLLLVSGIVTNFFCFALTVTTREDALSASLSQVMVGTLKSSNFPNPNDLNSDHGSMLSTNTNNSTENPFGFTPHLREVLYDELLRQCGPSCVDAWKKIEMDSTGKSLEEVLHKEMTKTQKQLMELYEANSKAEGLGKKMVSETDGETSYLQMPLMEVPCVDEATCAAVELLNNRCDYMRLGTMAVYQSLNLAVHTFAIVTKAVCLCFDVFTVSACILQPVPIIPCQEIGTILSTLLSGSHGTWTAVKAATAKCKVFGDVRASLFS